MTLSAEDKKILKEWGYPESDFPQIQEAIKVTIYTLTVNDGEGTKKKISAKKAREILGDKTFLSGISRSAFHWSSGRESEDGQYISFDSSRLFK